MYKESQKMDDMFLYIFLVLLSVINLIMYRIYLENELTLFYMSVFSLFIMFLVFKVFRLDTTFSEKGILYRFFPIQFKEKLIPWTEIKSLEIKKIRPLRDYGGYGIRFNLRSRAYIMKGNTGLLLQFKDGKKPIVFGIENKDLVVNSLKINSPKTPLTIGEYK